MTLMQAIKGLFQLNLRLAQFCLVGMRYTTADNMTTLLDLYYEGVIDYLVKTGVMSPTILSYIQYFLEFNQLKIEGNTYRESVRVLAYRHHVSETTIKKGIRIVQMAQGSQKFTLRIADPRMDRPIIAASL